MLVGWLYEQFLIELKLDLYVNRQKNVHNALVGMFHANTNPSIKEYVLSSITSPNEKNACSDLYKCIGMWC